MNLFIFSLSLFFLITFGNATLYTFKVVSLNNKNVNLGVKYNNNQILKLTATTFPLFEGSVNVDNINKYKYVIFNNVGEITEEESFERTYSKESEKLNEVYNRTNKKVEVPNLPEPFGQDYKMGSKEFQAFPSNAIYNIYAECDEAQYTNRKNNPFLTEDEGNNEPFNCTFTVVTPDTVFQSNGNMHLLGYGSRLFKKLSWVLKFDQKFLKRKSIKLRGIANDPTLLRDKLASDMYKAIGVPTQEGTYARFIINNDVLGLYNIMDGISEKWFASYIHGDTKAHVGTSYKLVSSHPEGPYADLKYNGDDYIYYEECGSYLVDEIDKADVEAATLAKKINKRDDEEENVTNNKTDNTSYNNESAIKWYRFINFLKLYHDWVEKYQNDNTDAAVKALEEFLDIESTLKILAMDSLTLASDNFFFVESNTELYYNPERKKYQFIPYDFDDSLRGDNDYIEFEEIKDDCINWIKVKELENNDHYFTDNLLKHQQIKDRYDVILSTISRKLFTLDILSPRIDAIADLIREDVEWNFNIINQYQSNYEGIVNNYTLKNFEDNLNNIPIDDVSIENPYPYGLKEYIQLRGDSCRAYTKDVKPQEKPNKGNLSSNSGSSLSSSSDRVTNSFSFSLIIIFTTILFYLYSL